MSRLVLGAPCRCGGPIPDGPVLWALFVVVVLGPVVVAWPLRRWRDRSVASRGIDQRAQDDGTASDSAAE